MSKIIPFPDKKERQALRRAVRAEQREQRTQKAGSWFVRFAAGLFFAVRLIAAGLAEKALEIALVVLHTLRIPLFLIGGVYCFINYHQNDKHWITPTDKSTAILTAVIVVAIFSEMLLDMLRHIQPLQRLLGVRAKPSRTEESEPARAGNE